MPNLIEISSTNVVVADVVAVAGVAVAVVDVAVVAVVVDSTLVTCSNGITQIRDIFVEKNNKFVCFLR